MNIDNAIERLRIGAAAAARYYEKPLMICYSGGKDSDALIELARISGITFEVVHSHTTADAPETVRYIRKRFYDLELEGYKCSITYPIYRGARTSMWDLIVSHKMPPTRRIRYCCQILKETAGAHRAVATGVRWAESSARKQRGIYEDINKNRDKRVVLVNDNDNNRVWFERCEVRAKTVINPIIDWSDGDVGDFLSERRVELNPLYGCGFSRVGCIGCPMAGKKRYKEFERYPRYARLYMRAFERMLVARKTSGMESSWENAYDVFRWWMEEDFRQYEIDEVRDRRLKELLG